MDQKDFERDAIINIQRYLRHLSFHDEHLGERGAIPIDGIWESATEEALMNFQGTRGLPVTGIADRTTWDLLREEYERSVAINSPPAALDIFPRHTEGFAVRVGASGFLAEAVNYLLRELERLYYFRAPLPDGEVFDERSAELVADFQRRNRLPDSGEVDRLTWDAMVIQHNSLLGYEE